MGMDPAIITLLVMGIVAVLMATEVIPLAVTAMCAAVSLCLLGVLTPVQAFAGLSNSTVVLFAGMFVVGEAMFATGLAHKIAVTVVHAVGTGERRLMSAIMALTVVKSATASNTATVACLMPVVNQICSTAKIPVSPQLMALAIAANVGGTITLIGTPPNVMMSAALDTAGYTPFSFFEFALIGVPLSLVGILYMVLIGRRLCPQNFSKVKKDEFAKETSYSGKKMLICATIIIAVVIGMLYEKELGIPLHVISVIGALACVLTGCLSEEEAYRGIDWVTIFLFAGMLPVASAMEMTGAGRMIANAVMDLAGSSPSPYLLTFLMFLISCGLTQFMSNTAAAALLAPIGISISSAIGVSPYPVLMSIGIAASCAFTTPMATPPNTLVMAPGQLKFMDYVKVGLPLAVLSMLLCVVLIPIFWPFYP